MAVAKLCILCCIGIVANGHEIGVDRVKSTQQESFVLERTNCRKNDATSGRLSEVRRLFDKYNIEAYIITDDDVHMDPGGYSISQHDHRIEAVSGFSKNFGIAVVTRTHAALWTDGRKFGTAIEEADCGWELYRKGGANTTTVTKWIVDTLKDKTRGSSKVGSDPEYMNAVWWKNFERLFSPWNITLEPIVNDLVDQVWTTGRKLTTSSDINALDIKYSGRSWQDKVTDVRREMSSRNVDALVVTGVDEIAWLFNLRAKDFAFMPYFYSLALVEKNTTSLYIMDSRSKLLRTPSDPESKLRLKDHLRTGEDGRCSIQGQECVQVKEYDHEAFVRHVTDVERNQDVRSVWISYYCNYRIYSVIPESKVYQAIPPTLYLKGQKNFVERQGMRKSNLLDSVEIVEFFARLEKEVLEGIPWTVYSAAQEAIKVRSRSLSLYRDQSFNTLSGSGARGADFHYHPHESTDHMITTHEIFNQDSGANYLDGTSDITRTFHYGTPSEVEKEMYTRVLMGHINLSKLKFPVGKTGREIDVVSREPLWEVGADYAHETGHGISHYGAVVEGPARISCIEETHMSDVALASSLFENGNIKLEIVPDWADYPIDEHMCFTTEPGYYEPGHYGIRTENVMIVRKVEHKENYKNNRNLQSYIDVLVSWIRSFSLWFYHKNNRSACGFLEFETVTFIPYEPHLINYDLLSQSQMDWMNSYHKEVWDKISPFLKKQDNKLAIEWLYKRVQPVYLNHSTQSTVGDKHLKIEL